MILNNSQARAVYDAMCALNNVDATIKASFGDESTEGINVFEARGNVCVVRVVQYGVTESQVYANQAAFAKAYGLA